MLQRQRLLLLHVMATLAAVVAAHSGSSSSSSSSIARCCRQVDGVIHSKPKRNVLSSHAELLWKMTTMTSIPRGGASISSSSSNSSSSMLQTIIRSILNLSEQTSPTLYSLVESFFRTMENFTGIQLLMPVAETKSKSMKKRKKQNKNHKQTMTTTTTKTTVPAEKVSKNKSAVKATAAPLLIKKTRTTQKTSSPSTTKATQMHMTSDLKSTNPNYRIQRELKEFLRDPPTNLKVKVGSNIRIWIITMEGAVGSVYEGETYKLRVSFPKGYPTVPPSVYFLSPPPLHEHVYTNGDICLSLLGKDWKPTMTAQSIALSILSILSSASSKCLPMDNARHSQNKPGQYQKDWIYHDDNC
jgi:ubiquitin-conjugating enzyme E2 W